MGLLLGGGGSGAGVGHEGVESGGASGHGGGGRGVRVYGARYEEGFEGDEGVEAGDEGSAPEGEKEWISGGAETAAIARSE